MQKNSATMTARARGVKKTSAAMDTAGCTHQQKVFNDAGQDWMHAENGFSVAAAAVTRAEKGSSAAEQPGSAAENFSAFEKTPSLQAREGAVIGCGRRPCREEQASRGKRLTRYW